MALWSELAGTLDWNRAIGVWSAPIDAPNVEKFMSEAGATADVLGVSRDMSEWEEGLLYLIGVENSGTGTADVTFQASPDRGMTWMDHTAFTQLTATANEMIKLTQIPRRGRLELDLGASGSPNYDITVYFEGTKKRQGRGI